jgi:hypothetical protein
MLMKMTMKSRNDTKRVTNLDPDGRAPRPPQQMGDHDYYTLREPLKMFVAKEKDCTWVSTSVDPLSLKTRYASTTAWTLTGRHDAGR